MFYYLGIKSISQITKMARINKVTRVAQKQQQIKQIEFMFQSKSIQLLIKNRKHQLDQTDKQEKTMSSNINISRNPTNDNNIIPNVSCVFRDLVHLSHTSQPRLNTNVQQQQSYNMNYYNNNYGKQRVDLISNMGVDDRQRRHEQLMSRFKSSLEENRQLLGINQASSTPYQYQYERAHINQNRNSQQYSISQPSYSQQPPPQSKKWSIPQIKYRHIEDFQQKKIQPKYVISDQPSKLQQAAKDVNNNQPQATTTTQSKLQRQFYENNSNSNQQQVTQELANKYSRFAGSQREQQAKYNQNLQSYYELCRKPLRPAFRQQDAVKQTSTKINEEKFLRKPQSKVGGINLSKAIQILSLD